MEIIDAGQLRGRVSALLDDGFRLALMAGHDDVDAVRIVYALTRGADAVELAVVVPDGTDGVPSIADLSYAGGRFEREIHDLFGVTPLAHPFPHRLVRHDNWPVGHYPMRRDADPAPEFQPASGDFPFVQVSGDGVYEIPVGPIHAGLIEPGHFRFSVVGESIVRMKARLWFLYRGVEKVFEGMDPADGIALAERISGDTAVGHSLAYVRAVEAASGMQVSVGDDAVRLLLLELERIHNHVADIGMIINDVGYGIVNTQCQVLRERLLRHNAQVTGHRLLRGGIVLGGARWAGAPDLELLADIGRELEDIVELALDHRGVRDRLTGTSVLTNEQALSLQTLGYVARASGVDVDHRVHETHPGLAGFAPVVENDGDVLARFMLRVREVRQSLELIAALAEHAVTGSSDAAAGIVDGSGLGRAEAWRGTVHHRVEIAGGRLSRVKVVDPSFFNWPALSLSLADTIVPDFPLTNKSFNQSYAGNDL